MCSSKRILGMLSLCRRAGRLSLGFDLVREGCKTGKTKLVLMAADLSPASAKRIAAAAAQNKIHTLTLPVQMLEVAQVTGKLTGILGVDDQGFAAQLEKLIGCPHEEEDCI